MKNYLSLLLVLFCSAALAQQKTVYKTTQQFTITGQVKKESAVDA
jgi:hypothetical protein